MRRTNGFGTIENGLLANEKALLAINDLGPAGETWSLNSVSYAQGHTFHRSMKEVVCIGTKTKP